MSKDEKILKNCEDMLLKVGVARHLAGFLYLRDALVMMVKSGLVYGRSGIGWLYAGISNDRRISIRAIEKGMRYAIEYAFNCGNLDVLYEFFPLEYNCGRPTNLSFLVVLASKIYKILN